MQFKTLKIRKVHRWMTLLFGAQLIIWSITGAVMVILQLPYIHGHHLSQQADQPLSQMELLEQVPKLQTRYPEATQAALVRRFIDGDFRYVFRVRTQDTRFLVNAFDLEIVSLSADDIRHIAELTYADSLVPKIHAKELILDAAEMPQEVNPAHAPVWRVEFADARKTTFYFAAETGDLLTQRHQAWRVFDVMWMLHIMDYTDRHRISTPWLYAFTVLTFFIAITGLWLLLQRHVLKLWRRSWRA